MKVLVVSFLLLQLSACASLVNKQSSSSGTFSQVNNNINVSAQRNWGVVGRVSIKQENNAWLANIDWQHDDVVDELVISASLSGVLANIRYQEKQIIVETQDGVQVLKNNDALQRVVGFNPPINYLKYWARGLVVPNVELLNDTGLVKERREFEQAGWRVQLSKYRQVSDIWLPHSVSVKNKRLNIKLAIEQWLK
jgi:outer membrane lipoprotein LolB